MHRKDTEESHMILDTIHNNRKNKLEESLKIPIRITGHKEVSFIVKMLHGAEGGVSDSTRRFIKERIIDHNVDYPLRDRGAELLPSVKRKLGNETSVRPVAVTARRTFNFHFSAFQL